MSLGASRASEATASGPLGSHVSFLDELVNSLEFTSSLDSPEALSEEEDVIPYTKVNKHEDKPEDPGHE